MGSQPSTKISQSNPNRLLNLPRTTLDWCISFNLLGHHVVFFSNSSIKQARKKWLEENLQFCTLIFFAFISIGCKINAQVPWHLTLVVWHLVVTRNVKYQAGPCFDKISLHKNDPYFWNQQKNGPNPRPKLPSLTKWPGFNTVKKVSLIVHFYFWWGMAVPWALASLQYYTSLSKVFEWIFLWRVTVKQCCSIYEHTTCRS